jgi:HAD superfamily hydrolase (TIGR01549 family)
VRRAPRRPWTEYTALGVQQVIAPSTVVTFDVGQTLAELDLDFLARRLAERGRAVESESLRGAAPAAWDRYEALVREGARHPWKALMHTLLAGAGIGEPADLVEWLWTEQRANNLWRQPIPSMVALARELAASGARVGVLSNSEGRLAELLVEIGIADAFATIVDSGRIGIEKPDRRIFAHVLAELGAPADARPIHIGDLWNADIRGAIDAGWRAIWYGKHATPVDDPRIASARDRGARGARCLGRSLGR